ncbi:MAG: HU family DNA-binding protein [Candidatus Micrarchaeaceae archaeon]
MLKKELVSKVAEKVGLSVSDVSKVFDALDSTVHEELVNTGEVKLLDFGTFKLKTVPEHTGRNPATGESVTVPQKTVVHFKLSKTWKRV